MKNPKLTPPSGRAVICRVQNGRCDGNCPHPCNTGLSHIHQEGTKEDLRRELDTALMRVKDLEDEQVADREELDALRGNHRRALEDKRKAEKKARSMEADHKELHDRERSLWASYINTIEILDDYIRGKRKVVGEETLRVLHGLGDKINEEIVKSPIESYKMDTSMWGKLRRTFRKRKIKIYERSKSDD